MYDVERIQLKTAWYLGAPTFSRNLNLYAEVYDIIIYITFFSHSLMLLVDFHSHSKCEKYKRTIERFNGTEEVYIKNHHFKELFLVLLPSENLFRCWCESKTVLQE